MLVAAKAVHFGRPGGYGWSAWARDVAVSSHEDVAFAAGFGLAAAGLLLLLRRWPRARTWAGWGLVALGAVFAFYAVVSIHVFDFLRSPLTYALLYLAGDADAMSSSIGSFLTPGVLAAVVLVPAAYVLSVRRTRGLSGARGIAVAAGLVAAAAAWSIAGGRTAAGRWSDRSDVLIAESPHVEIVASTASVLLGGGEPMIADAFPAAHLEDFRPALATRTTAPRGRGVRNVLVVVLESTGARYLSLYGSPYRTTPHLDAEAAHALVYDRFYAHVGFTANSLAALTLSVHPYMTWREYTSEYPEFPGRTAADVLHGRGYRTAFLTTAFIDYVNVEGFLRNRGYDEVSGWKELARGVPELNSWGGTDEVLVDRTLEWIDRDPSRPFYATVWTQQTHHPYDPVPGRPEADFFRDGPRPADGYDLGRYLNAVADVDRQIGRLFAGLRERGLDDETLVVVTGDHGEAFGEPHPTWGHGFRLYDESVRTPLMIWSPALFERGARVATVGGHVDVSPTVLDLLGVEAPAEWEGRSLFAPDRPPRVYFYAANDHYLLGVREGDLKYVYNATSGRDQLFDLARDPDETTNLAESRPADCRRLRQHLAAWKQHAAGRLTAARAFLARREEAGTGPQADLRAPVTAVE